MPTSEPYTEPLPPLVADAVRAASADGLREAGSNQALAKALGIDPSDSSRLRTGHPAKRSVATLAGELFWRLGTNYPRTTPFPLIAHYLVLTRKSLMLGANTDTLRRRFADLERKELSLEYERNRLIREGADPLDVAEARERLSAVLTELAALGQEIAGREAAS
jgi:hypothetical protein